MELLCNVCLLLSKIVGLYSLVLIIRIIVSWILFFNRQNSWRSGYGSYGYNQNYQKKDTLSEVDAALGKVCDPYLNWFKRFKAFQRSNLDFTPVLGFVVLSLVKNILLYIGQTGHVSLWLFLAVIVDGIWSSIISFVWTILLILLIVRLLLGKGNSAQAYNTINSLDSILEGPVGKVYKLFYKNKNFVNDEKLVLVSLVFYGALYFVAKACVSYLVTFLCRL
ncbi:MAG: YggT family protein [Sphaerochaetaceae bacterium]|nr:YggT family protein [Sphaerochaetaceae bacterium]